MFNAQDNFELSNQNPAWSKEDEEIHRKCICAMRAYACGFPEEEKFVEQVDNWLKSLKERVQPQSQWKPSESDIRILEQVIDGTANPINYHATLHAILEKLKKLREK